MSTVERSGAANVAASTDTCNHPACRGSTVGAASIHGTPEMTPPTPEPNRTERAERARRERIAREAEALRVNLRRRKAQDRARTGTAQNPDPVPDRRAPQT